MKTPQSHPCNPWPPNVIPPRSNGVTRFLCGAPTLPEISPYYQPIHPLGYTRLTPPLPNPAGSGQGSHTHSWTDCTQSYQQIGFMQKLYHTWCCNPTVLAPVSLGHLQISLSLIVAEKANGYTLRCPPGTRASEHYARAHHQVSC